MIVEPRRDVTRDGHRAKVEPVTQDVESGLGLTKTRFKFYKALSIQCNLKNKGLLALNYINRSAQIFYYKKKPTSYSNKVTIRYKLQYVLLYFTNI